MRKRRWFLAGALLFFAALAFAQNMACPIDGSSSQWTGETKIDNATAKLLKQYECIRGHVFWVVVAH